MPKQTAKEIAVLIVAKLDTDPKFAAEVQESPEFFRAMVYGSGIVANPAKIDGTDEYHAIVDELEALMC